MAKRRTKPGRSGALSFKACPPTLARRLRAVAGTGASSVATGNASGRSAGGRPLRRWNCPSGVNVSSTISIPIVALEVRRLVLDDPLRDEAVAHRLGFRREIIVAFLPLGWAGIPHALNRAALLRKLEL